MSSPPVRVATAYVTGDAAAALGPDGRFVMPDSVVNPKGELNEEQARRVAVEMLKAFGATAGPNMSRDRGRIIDAYKLHPCDRAIYAASPVVSMTPTPSEWGRRVWGAHWIVPLCDGSTSTAVAMFSVSARATEIIQALDAKTRVPWSDGHMDAIGIRTSIEPMILDPETAVERAFRITGRRVTQVPTVVMAPLPYPPVTIRWRVPLETSVRVRGSTSGVSRDRGTLLMGFVNSFLESGPVDPRVDKPDIERTWTDLDGTPIRIVLSPFSASEVERVTVEGGT